MYLVQKEKGKPWSDAGGKRVGDQMVVDTMWREAYEEIGITVANVTKVHGIFTSMYYTLIVVNVDKEPVAKEAGSAVKRVEKYSMVKGDKSRLGIWKNRGLPEKSSVFLTHIFLRPFLVLKSGCKCPM